MATNKNSFLLYTDVHHTVKKLTDVQAGVLFKHILSYVNDENPSLNDILLEIAFEPIKQSLKRDLCKYEVIRTKRSEAGKASANKRQQVLTNDGKCEQVSTLSTVSDSVSVSVSVSDIEEKEKTAPSKPLLKKSSAKERSYEYLPIAKRLSRIVQETKNITHEKQQIHSWANEIRKLVETNSISVERINKGLDYLQKHSGEMYCPEIESGLSLREKFTKIESAISRDKLPQQTFKCPSNWKFGVDYEEGKQGCRNCEEYHPNIHAACKLKTQNR